MPTSTPSVIPSSPLATKPDPLASEPPPAVHTRVCAGYKSSFRGLGFGFKADATFCLGSTDINDSGFVGGLEFSGGLDKKDLKGGFEFNPLAKEFSLSSFTPSDDALSTRDFEFLEVGYISYRRSGAGNFTKFSYTVGSLSLGAGQARRAELAVTGRSVSAGLEQSRAVMEQWYREALRQIGYTP